MAVSPSAVSSRMLVRYPLGFCSSTVELVISPSAAMCVLLTMSVRWLAYAGSPLRAGFGVVLSSATIAAALCERRPQGSLQVNNCIWLTDGHAHAQNLSGHITPHSIGIDDLNQDMPGESGAGGNGGAVRGFRNRSSNE